MSRIHPSTKWEDSLYSASRIKMTCVPSGWHRHIAVTSQQSRSLTSPPHGHISPVMRIFDFLFFANPSNLLHKQPMWRWFETLWRSCIKHHLRNIHESLLSRRNQHNVCLWHGTRFVPGHRLVPKFAPIWLFNESILWIEYENRA